MAITMASVVLFEKDEKKYSCKHCMSGKVWKAQGRSEEWIAERLKRRLISKGCLKDAKTEVLRLVDGGRVYRCPRALADSGGAVNHFEEVADIMEGRRVFSGDGKPWKWHTVRKRIQNEILQVRRLERKNAEAKAGGR